MHITHEINLMHFIEKNLGRAFAWGECDCVTFALEVTDAVYGTALAEKIKGRYKTERGAIRFRRRSRWGNFITLLKEANFIEIPKGFEQTGDILVVEEAGKLEMVHVSLGHRALSSHPETGVLIFPMTHMQGIPYTVWRYTCRQE